MIYLQDPDFVLHQGDALEVLQGFPDESVHMCVTSPPFYGLRDYGTEGQIGLEASPDQWVAALVDVFREVRRVLRSDGTLWLEIGDSYASTAPGTFNAPDLKFGAGKEEESAVRARYRPVTGFKPKDLIGAPWLLAFALRADGWYLRSDIIWSKPNPMPESVRDRPTKSHSYVFLLSKSPRYFFDQEAVREPSYREAGPLGNRTVFRGGYDGGANHGGAGGNDGNPAGRNIRSVWTISTEPLPDEHYAAYPSRLVERCILAGCPEGGTVLDPFLGSGTSALVARKHGRRTIGIELSPTYCAMAARRLSQLSLLAELPESRPILAPHKGLAGGAYSPPGQTPHSNARDQ